MIALPPQQTITLDSGILFDFLLKKVATTVNFPDPGMVHTVQHKCDRILENQPSWRI